MSGRAVDVTSCTLLAHVVPAKRNASRDPDAAAPRFEKYCSTASDHTTVGGYGSQLSQGRLREVVQPSRPPRLRPIAVAQMPLHQLAGRRARQFGLEVDAARAFDRRQMLAAEQHQLGFELLSNL